MALAATPPPTSTSLAPNSAAAAEDFSTSASTTAAWKEAARSATGSGAVFVIPGFNSAACALSSFTRATLTGGGAGVSAAFDSGTVVVTGGASLAATKV